MIIMVLCLSMQDDVDSGTMNEGISAIWGLKAWQDKALSGQELSEWEEREMNEYMDYRSLMDRTWPYHKIREAEDRARELLRKVSLDLSNIST